MWKKIHSVFDSDRPEAEKAITEKVHVQPGIEPATLRTNDRDANKCATEATDIMWAGGLNYSNSDRLERFPSISKKTLLENKPVFLCEAL